MTRKHTPDIVLMDMSLPVMDGWEATRRFKIDEKLCAISVIAVFAHDMRGGEEKATPQVCPGGEKNDQLAFHMRADLQNKAIGWLRRGDNCCDGEICI